MLGSFPGLLPLSENPEMAIVVKNIVAHMNSKGIYVWLTLFDGMGLDSDELSIAESVKQVAVLAEVFKGDLGVAFVCTNEFHKIPLALQSLPTSMRRTASSLFVKKKMAAAPISSFYLQATIMPCVPPWLATPSDRNPLDAGGNNTALSAFRLTYYGELMVKLINSMGAVNLPSSVVTQIFDKFLGR